MTIPPLDEETRLKHDTAKAQRATALLGVLSGALALGLAVVGALAKGASDELAATKSEAVQATDAQQELARQLQELQADLDDLRTQSASVSAERDTLKEENSRLQAAIDNSEATNTPVGETLTADVWREGDLTVNTTSRWADFDSPSTDPQWGRDINSSVQGELGRVIAGRTIEAGTNTALSPRVKRPTYDDCMKATDYLEEFDISIPKHKEGDWFCFRTDNNRMSILQITKFSNTEITLRITVYDARA